MSEKVEYVEVKVKVPTKIMKFLEGMVEQGSIESVQEYLEYSVLEAVEADINSDDVFVPSFEQLVKRYDLSQIFEVGVGSLPLIFPLFFGVK